MNQVSRCISLAGLALALALVAAPSITRASEAEVLGALTPWRAHLVMGGVVFRKDGKLQRPQRGRTPEFFDPAKAEPPAYPLTALPPADWVKPDFEDTCWPRYQADLADYLGAWGASVGTHPNAMWPALVCLRTYFGIADPAQVKDLKLKLVLLGGAVVYVNGQEIGRGHMPAGDILPLTLAEDYGIEAYTTDDGQTPLPGLTLESKPPDAKLLPRYDQRVRTVTLDVPAKALVKGRNVLAIALHRAPNSGPFAREGWAHVGFREASLTSASGAGVIPYATATQGTHVWSASTVDQVAETFPQKSLIRRSWFWAMLAGRGAPVKGVQQANPYDPLRPIRMTMPRNGVGSGQTVLSDANGLQGVSAALEPFQGPGGTVLPASAVQIRYAVQPASLHYCDTFVEKAPDGKKTLPVWLIIQAPKNQAPGWYTSTLRLEANGKKFSVPVQTLVTGHVVCDSKDFTGAVNVVHSPETLAKHYNVELWSDAHWKLLEKSFALLAQTGNDVVHVPIIVSGVGGTGKSGVGFNWQPLIRWTKNGNSLKPDFFLLEKYLDAYLEHCAPPRGMTLYIWGASSAKELADAYENRRIPSRENVKYAPPRVLVVDPATKAVSEHAAPAFGDAGDEAFWKPLLDGVRALVVKRGWSERIIMLGLGGDIRPGQKTTELLKQWAPYARWDFLSHFSGDPGPKDGKMIATGAMEVGLMEWPAGTDHLPLKAFEERVLKPYDFLELPTNRWSHQEYSPPLIFRTMAATWGCIGRIGLDFWLAQAGGPRSTSFFSHVNSLTAPGPAGAEPGVRFQLFREGLQDAEIKTAIVTAYLKLPEEQRKPYQALLNELSGRIQLGGPWYLGQNELSADWPAYVARLHAAAAELTGQKIEATWDNPPAKDGR